MHELIIIGAGPHALSLVSTLLERRPDRYLEHPDNGLLFYRTKVDAGDNTRTSHRIHARHYHEDASKGKDKHEREKVQKVLNGAGKVGSRLNAGKRCTDLWEDGHVDIRVRDPSGLRLAHASGAASLAGGLPTQWLLDSMLILDKCVTTEADERLGSWLPSWKKQMEFLRVPHLRSPVNHHPDPSDGMILWQYAVRPSNGKKNAHHLVPSRLQRDKFYTGPFLLPSTEIFWDFCGKAMIDAFGLRNHVSCADVSDIIPMPCGCEEIGENGNPLPDTNGTNEAKFCDHFKVLLADGRIQYARNVVLATGSCNFPRNIPDWAQNAREADEHPPERLAHVYDIAEDHEAYFEKLNGKVLDEFKKLAGKGLLIVGGGITSVHLTRVALDYGCTSVHLISRSKIRIQPFDVNLKWFGPRRPALIASYWSTTCPKARAKLLQEARYPGSDPSACDGCGAASVTDEAWQLIEKGIGDGRVTVTEMCQVDWAQWEKDEFNRGVWKVGMEDGEESEYDLIWLATGSSPTTAAHPLLKTTQVK
ncbi:hypothetical protein HK097_009807, partial [Rhizophlyctis rosea]